MSARVASMLYTYSRAVSVVPSWFWEINERVVDGTTTRGDLLAVSWALAEL